MRGSIGIEARRDTHEPSDGDPHISGQFFLVKDTISSSLGRMQCR